MLRLEPTVKCGIADGGARERGKCATCQVSIGSHVDQRGLARLRAMAQRVSFAKGETLFEQGDALDEVCILSDGIIKLYHILPDGQNQITGFLGPGDILGGIKREEIAHGTAKTLTAGNACLFPRETFLALIADYPDLCLNLLITATDEIEALNDHIILLGRKRAPERLAAFLLMLSHRWNADQDYRTTVHLPMSRTDIADHLGLTVETVSRIFAQFRESRYIATPKRSVVKLNNLAALYGLAGFEEIPAKRVALGL